MITKFEAIHALVGKGVSGPSDGSISEYTFHDGQNPPTEKEIEAKLTELKNAEPMRILRQERNAKLAETDWWYCSDQNPTKAQLDYRAALRNLPSTASPSLDENGNLTGVEWPKKPQN
jgi:hypothetical protein